MNNKPKINIKPAGPEGFGMAMKILISGLMNQNFKPMVVQKNRASKENRKETKKGARHKVNPPFKSRSIFSVTPAEYRNLHMGAKQTGE